MDSTAQRALVGYEIFKEHSVAAESEIINETASTGDAWIRHSKQPMWQTVLGFQKASTKLLLRVTHAFESANSHVDLEIINEN